MPLNKETDPVLDSMKIINYGRKVIDYSDAIVSKLVTHSWVYWIRPSPSAPWHQSNSYPTKLGLVNDLFQSGLAVHFQLIHLG